VLGTVAFQTLWPVRMKQKKADPDAKPPLLDSCHAFRADGPVVKRYWPQHYTGA
jgi:hypothetical protein